ncbi:hypothetical protein G6F60_015054 [Rhizopus arrhizus]|nr:hypothetical protein G6F60_015054 [Rhizopus arrhizus]
MCTRDDQVGIAAGEGVHHRLHLPAQGGGIFRTEFTGHGGWNGHRHQQGQQRQPARHGTDHGNSWGGGNASSVVRCRQRGIMRRVTAGAGNWR